ncbi:hypothetical protein GALMADRAFT_236327 [Galerina marginata CBS 339.88]|uniref:Uncharacterized protein n=1 Tax=Galerina marginata (strain CBS 339.88) TaxID=685588 RepID=A0A067TVA3_GALM3|nr:hypothetical protein GALMADRAFT_236327 [Galerina marginata CBS 339.88]
MNVFVKGTTSDTSPNKVPSLVDLTLRPAVEQAIRADDIGQLEPLIFHPDKLAIMLEVIRAQNPTSEGGIISLIKMINEVHRNSILDLSGFNLSGRQLITILASEQETDDFQTPKSSAKYLTTLSRHQGRAANTRDFDTLSLRRLFLWNTAVSNDDLIDLLGMHPKLFYSLEGVIHPVLMKSQGNTICPAAFVHINGSEMNQSAKAYIPYSLLVKSLKAY